MAHSSFEKGKHVVIDLNKAPEDSDVYKFGTCNGEYGHRQDKSTLAIVQPLELEKTLRDLSAEEVLHTMFNSEAKA
ncbi:unnamed protein product, partial [Ilex paraguariensis]